MNISFTKTEVYSNCPYKYYLQYVEKWNEDKTHSALLFGKSIDVALNYLLLRTKHHHVPYNHVAYKLFMRMMNTWQGQNELCYYKNECPETNSAGMLFEDLNFEERQWVVHNHLISIGIKMIDVYLNEILPQFKKIISVQTKKFVPNEAGDNLVLITDFTAEMPDGRIITFDNKTSSDIKKYYGPNSVKKSQQLAIYTEFEPTKLAGYIALSKKIKNDKIDFQIVIDEIEEDQTVQAFERIDVALNAIKREEFPKNDKSCWPYGKKCAYWNACKHNNFNGLIKNEK